MKRRSLAVPGVIVAVIAATVAPNLWRKQRADHHAQSSVRVEGMPGESAATPAAQVRTDGRLPPGMVAAPDAASTEAAAFRHGPASGTESAGAAEAALLRDPSWRAARLAELRALQVQANPGLADELALTVDEASLVFDTLAGTRLAVEMEAALAELPAVDPEERAAATRHRREMQRQQGEVLRGLLGDQRYRQWQDYLQTRPVRQQASRHAAALEGAGVPLDAGQVRILTRAMIAEQESLRQDILALGGAVDLSQPHTQLEAQQALRARRSESSRNLLSATAPFLDALQFEALRTQLEQQGATEGGAAKP